jgi:hypothetical protein
VTRGGPCGGHDSLRMNLRHIVGCSAPMLVSFDFPFRFDEDQVRVNVRLIRFDDVDLRFDRFGSTTLIFVSMGLIRRR